MKAKMTRSSLPALLTAQCSALRMFSLRGGFAGPVVVLLAEQQLDVVGVGGAEYSLLVKRS